MKKVLLIIFIVLIFPTVKSQEKSFGCRGGVSSGFTYQKFLEANRSMEAIMSFRRHGIQFTLLRQIHEIALTEYVDNVFFIKGYGFHGGIFNEKTYYFAGREFSYTNNYIAPVLGINAYFALEYRVPSLPIRVGFDIKPFIEFSYPVIFNAVPYDFGFFLKYTFENL
jgi:hypothetical protein